MGCLFHKSTNERYAKKDVAVYNDAHQRYTTRAEMIIRAIRKDMNDIWHNGDTPDQCHHMTLTQTGVEPLLQPHLLRF